MNHDKNPHHRPPERSRDAVARYERLLEQISTLAEALAVAADLPAVYRLVLEFVRRCAPCNGMFVALFDAARQQRRCVYAWTEGREEDVSQLPMLPMGDSPNSQAVRTGEIIVTDDYQAAMVPGQPRVRLGRDIDPRAPQSSLAVPMAVMGRVVGAMEIQSVDLAAYKPEHVTALRMMAPLAGMAIENVRLLENERYMRRAAQDSERRKAAILDSALDAIITIDHEGRILEFNCAAERMFGRSRDTVLGQSMAELIMSPALREAYQTELGRCAAATTTNRFREMSALRRDGTEFPAEFSIIHVGQCDPPLFTAFVRDLTQRRREEQVRESLQAQLRQSQKMQAIGTLASGIAHDFNNILAAILGNVELALQDAADLGARESLEEIRKAGRRGRDLVQQILSFSRPQPTSRKKTPLGTIVEEHVRMLRAALPAGVELRWTGDSAGTAVMADPTQIGQVVLNLGTNAAHAMRGRTGCVDIGVEAIAMDEPAARAIHGLRPGRYARLSVIDSGAGMEPSTLERIFEPFFTTKPAGQGTGLGLAFVHGIVRDHEGAICVKSAPGEGTRFDLYFPALPASPQLLHVVPPAPPCPGGHGQRILYLDDDEALVDLFTRMLRRAGYHVRGYVESDKALHALRADPDAFDVVVTDQNMPGMSGLDAARAIRGIRRGLPVILTSACVTPEMRDQASDAGIHAVISKAHAVDELHEILDKLGQCGERSRAAPFGPPRIGAQSGI